MHLNYLANNNLPIQNHIIILIETERIIVNVKSDQVWYGLGSSLTNLCRKILPTECLKNDQVGAHFKQMSTDTRKSFVMIQILSTAILFEL
jgi:hypothetical protein